ncbi:hypothetical protein WA026_011407 [Henosepilachna vigintioctopunctata]|uniref:C-type lectin domain-containing protein n=1 Tax=Henosepilachna vigintioctopunctata TaxID=420089 RepID=A0AAW1TR23_9CUCU
MDLLNIETEEENNLITQMLTNLTNIDHVWTSGTDLQEEGSYVWMSTGEGFTFTNWEPRQPDNFLNAEHCIEIRKSNEQGYYWNDSYCSYKFKFVCEVTNCASSCKC